MYRAIEIARFILSKCDDWGMPLDNLKLQKLLYFAWSDYYTETKQFLYNDRIEAWSYGPVVPSVYFHYRRYVSSKIPMIEPEPDIQPNDERILTSIIEKYACMSVGKLISMTHESGTPWSESIKNGRSSEISKTQIMRYCDGKRYRDN
jgi:uncharacterized phage-associated protein